MSEQTEDSQKQQDGHEVEVTSSIEESAENLKTSNPEESGDNALLKYKEKYYYMAAEYDNALKRFEREKSNILKFGSENILRDIIGSIDLFELTVNALQNDQDPKVKNVRVGLEMIRKQMLDTLMKHGLERVSALGSIFDPNVHEAVSQELNSEVEENSVIKEHQPGYKLNGRLIRAAKVVVSKKN